jgi:cation:H+ antiporter
VSVAVDVVVALVGLALILVAAERLVGAAVGVAVAVRLAPFTIAVVFIGFDPEKLFVGATAARNHSPGIALGSILGAAMVAVALAFGITAILAPVRIRNASPSLLAVPAASGVLLAGVAVDGELSRLDGAILVAGYAVAVAYLWRLGRRGVAIEAEGEAAEALERPPSRWRAIGLLAVSLGVLVVGSELLVDRARELIDAAGWSETAAGMSIVALAVSVEELARELPAARRGHPELAVGNVAGSMLAFFAFNAGVAALVQPIDVPDQVITTQIPIVLATVIVVIWLLARNAVGRAGGVILLLCYAAFVLSLA